MADLNKGKFQGLDENAKNNYADSFVGATKVAEKVKKGGSETTSDGYVVDAIDIDWGGLKLTAIADQWQHGLQTESSTEQNAGKGDNTKGIHSTAYLLNKISSSFTQIYNQIGKDDDTADSLRKRVKAVEDSISTMAGLTPAQLKEITDNIDKINKELADPGAAGTLVTILDTLDGFDKNKKGDVKKYIDDHDQTILGTATDSATAYTVYGVRKYVDTTAKENLIGTSTDTTIDTHYGLKNTLIGSYTDASTDDTIWGAKKYADNKVKELDATVRGNLTGDVTIADGKKVGVKVEQVDGKLTGVTVVTDDIASASELTTLSGTVSGHTTRIDTIDGKLADINGTVKNYVDTSIGALDATVDSTGGSHVAVQVVEEDGKVKTVTVTESNFDYEHITGADNKTLKETLENRDLAVSASLTELDERLDILEGSDSTNGSVANSIKNAVKTLTGSAGDASTDNTIWGAKNYALEVQSKSYYKAEIEAGSVLGHDGNIWPNQKTVYGVAKYTDEKIKALSNTAFKVKRIEDNGEGILVFSTVGGQQLG